MILHNAQLLAAYARNDRQVDLSGWLWMRWLTDGDNDEQRCKNVQFDGFSSLEAFKKRWFVLKCNHLFYFKHKPSSASKSIPLGMIVLEGRDFRVEMTKSAGLADQTPFTSLLLRFDATAPMSEEAPALHLLALESPSSDSDAIASAWFQCLSNASVYRLRKAMQKLYSRQKQQRCLIHELTNQLQSLLCTRNEDPKISLPPPSSTQPIPLERLGESPRIIPRDSDYVTDAQDLSLLKESIQGLVCQMKSLFEASNGNIEPSPRPNSFVSQYGTLSSSPPSSLLSTAIADRRSAKRMSSRSRGDELSFSLSMETRLPSPAITYKQFSFDPQEKHPSATLLSQQSEQPEKPPMSPVLFRPRSVGLDSLDDPSTNINSIDISISCTINSLLLNAVKTVTSASLSSKFINSVTSNAIGAVAQEAILYFLLFERIQSSNSDSVWCWQEVGRTEIAEVKDIHASFVVPLCLTFRPGGFSTDFRFEVHYPTEATQSCGQTDTMLAFVECSRKQLLAGLRPDRSSMSYQFPAEISVTSDDGGKNMSVHLFAPEKLSVGGTCYAGGEIVGQLCMTLQPAMPSFLPLPEPFQLNRSTTQRYDLPTTHHHLLQTRERLYESPYSFCVPVALLRFLISHETALLQGLRPMMTPNTHPQPCDSTSRSVWCGCTQDCHVDLEHVAVVQSNVTSNLLSYYEHVLKSLLERKREALDGGLFRRSVDKKDLDLQWIPINLCLQEFFVNDTNRDEVSLLQVTTAGAFAAHAMGFKSQPTPLRHDEQLDATQAHFVSYSLSQLQYFISVSRDSLIECCEAIRNKVGQIVDLPLHVDSRRRSACVEDVIHAVQTVQDLMAEIISLARQVLPSHPSDPTHPQTTLFSSISNAEMNRCRLATCSGMLRLETEDEALAICARISSRYLPDLATFTNQVLSHLQKQSEQTRSRMSGLSVALRDGQSQSLKGRQEQSQVQMKDGQWTDALEKMSQAIRAVQVSGDRLLAKTKAAIQQQALLIEHYSLDQSGRLMSAGEKMRGGVLQEMKRRDVIFSQALSTLVTGFIGMIHRWFRYTNASFSKSNGKRSVSRAGRNMNDELGSLPDSRQAVEDGLFWDGLLSVGYLAQFESLLSSQGDEKGMLEDMSRAILDLRHRVRLGIHSWDGGDIDEWSEDAGGTDPCAQQEPNGPVWISGTPQHLVVSVGLPTWIVETAPLALKSGHEMIQVCPVLFSEGINEQQVFANLSGETSVQERANMVGLRCLVDFVQRWKAYITKKVNEPWGSNDSLVYRFQYPFDLVAAVEDIVEEMKSYLGIDAGLAGVQDRLTNSENIPLSTSSPVGSNNTLDSLEYNSSSKKAWKCRLQNSTTLLLLAEQLTRLLSLPNPSSPAGSTRDYTMATQHPSSPKARSPKTGEIVSTCIYPTTPVSSRFTSCKSAKDRTSMSVTLEQALFLRYRHTPFRVDATTQPMDEEEGAKPRKTSRGLAAGSMLDALKRSIQSRRSVGPMTTTVPKVKPTSTSDPPQSNTALGGLARSVPLAFPLVNPNCDETKRQPFQPLNDTQPQPVMDVQRRHQVARSSEPVSGGYSGPVANKHGSQPIPRVREEECDGWRQCMHSDHFVPLLNAMRSDVGVRLGNVDRNLFSMTEAGESTMITVQRGDGVIYCQREKRRGKFAFGSLQWAMLPVLYRPNLRYIGSSTPT